MRTKVFLKFLVAIRKMFFSHFNSPQKRFEKLLQKFFIKWKRINLVQKNVASRVGTQEAKGTKGVGGVGGTLRGSRLDSSEAG